MKGLDAHLKALLVDLTCELPEVTERRMFGSEALFANGTIFAMVWDGRVLLRFPNEARFVTARDLEGAGIFDPMSTGKTMGKWVSMPEAMHDDVDALRPWVEEAHREAMSEPPKKKRQKRVGGVGSAGRAVASTPRASAKERPTAPRARARRRA